MTASLPPRLSEALESWGQEFREVELLGGGANSQVFRVELARDRKICVKLHHIDRKGGSPRYDREKAFYNAARDACRNWLPQDLHWDDERKAGFLEFIEGSPLGRLNQSDVHMAGEFVISLQQADRSLLQGASEGAMEWGDHLLMVDQRLQRLTDVEDEDAARFIGDELSPCWDKVRKSLRPGHVHRIVSPSDFGFHNALRTDSGGLCFYDFEHGGLDDAAKLVCDLFVRPGSAIPMEWVDVFCSSAGFEDEVRNSAFGLMDLYRVKWACIALNEFTAEGIERRGYAGADSSERKKVQLAKARALVAEVRK